MYEEKGGYLVRVAGFEVIGVMMDLGFWKWVCGFKPRVAVWDLFTLSQEAPRQFGQLLRVG